MWSSNTLVGASPVPINRIIIGGFHPHADLWACPLICAARVAGNATAQVGLADGRGQATTSSFSASQCFSFALCRVHERLRDAGAASCLRGLCTCFPSNLCDAALSFSSSSATSCVRLCFTEPANR